MARRVCRFAGLPSSAPASSGANQRDTWPQETAPLGRLIAEYAHRQGGEVLAVMECFEGPRMGQNIKWSPNRIADHLGLPQSRVDQIYDETLAAVWPIFEASPDYPAFQAWTERNCGRRDRGTEAR